MNKYILVIAFLFAIGLAVFIFNDSRQDLTSSVESSSSDLQLDVIKPIELKDSDETESAAELISRDRRVRPEIRPNNPVIDMNDEMFTEEGQSYMTLGEYMMKNEKHVNTNKYSEQLYQQLQYAQYNLKISKEIAALSKNLFIQTDEGKVVDQEVYDKIKTLRDKLIVQLKNYPVPQ